jgi:hypothetical protein
LIEYLPTSDNLFFPSEVFIPQKLLKGMGGVYNSRNINVYHYAGQNPVKYYDPNGKILDTLLDAAFIVYDLGVLAVDEIKTGGANRTTNLTALGMDVAFTLIPGATGGGMMVRASVKTAEHVAEKSAVKAGEKTVLHHSEPMFMGGAKKQPLTKLGESEHKQLHKELNQFLETKKDAYGNSMHSKRGNSGATIQQNFTGKERKEAMAEFYKGDGAKFTEAAKDFFSQNPALK